MRYAAVIHDRMNVVVRVEERPTEERAEKAGQFWTSRNRGWWYLIATNYDIDMYKELINA